MIFETKSSQCHYVVMVSFWFSGFIGDIRTELQAPMILLTSRVDKEFRLTRIPYNNILSEQIGLLPIRCAYFIFRIEGTP